MTKVSLVYKKTIILKLYKENYGNMIIELPYINFTAKYRNKSTLVFTKLINKISHKYSQVVIEICIKCLNV